MGEIKNQIDRDIRLVFIQVKSFTELIQCPCHYTQSVALCSFMYVGRKLHAQTKKDCEFKRQLRAGGYSDGFSYMQ